jgi:Polyketide cyclase / dehydrase and lipid transport
MKLLLILLAAVVALVLVVLVVGALLPRNHVVSRHIILRRSPAEIYQVVRDFSAAPSWRPDLDHVEMIPSGDNQVRFREHGKQGAVSYDLVEDLRDEKIVTRIADQNLGYSGSWTYTFQSKADGTRIEIVEAGEVSNVLFRFMSRFVFGHTSTIEKYLTVLGNKFGEQVLPEA